MSIAFWALVNRGTFAIDDAFSVKRASTAD